EVITTARTERHPYVRSLGADQVIDYPQQPFETAMDPVDVVLDTIGGTVQDRSFQVLKPGGILVSIVRPPDAGMAARYQVRGEWFFLEPDGEKLAKLGAYFTDGRIRPIVQQIFPLEDLPAAHRLSESGQTQGKIGIVVDPSQAETR
ncbi:MAG: zinc-binding dehydrogenase, partial [Sulfobacillus sp.]|nr:zinc-binding dehydrogenase [Sulfobacillus sp.]